MRSSLVAVAACLGVVSTLLLPATGATHWCDGGATIIQAGPSYLTVDGFANGENRVAAYVESNGLTGLQRGGPCLLSGPDLCQDSPTPDQCVFNRLLV